MFIDYQNSGWPHILSRNRATSSGFIIPDFSYNARRILRKGRKPLKYYTFSSKLLNSVFIRRKSSSVRFAIFFYHLQKLL